MTKTTKTTKTTTTKAAAVADVRGGVTTATMNEKTYRLFAAGLESAGFHVITHYAERGQKWTSYDNPFNGRRVIVDHMIDKNYRRTGVHKTTGEQYDRMFRFGR